MFVEDYLINGICEGCDIDPAMCYNNNKCFYETQKSKYNFFPGDKVFVILKCKNSQHLTQIIVVEREIDSLKGTTETGRQIYWVCKLNGEKAGSFVEDDIFKTKEEALKEAYERVVNK